LKFLKDNGYPVRYQKVINARATSDDEADEGGQVVNYKTLHWIRRRPERSDAAEKFIRRLDELRKQSIRQSPGRRWTERPRRIHPTHQKDSVFVKLPTNMPIDYFKPAFYNSLLPRLRYDIASHEITFLPEDQQPFEGSLDEKLTTKEFRRKYGKSVLGRYKLVTEDDFADDEDDEEDEEDDDDDEEQVQQQVQQQQEGMPVDDVQGNGQSDAEPDPKPALKKHRRSSK